MRPMLLRRPTLAAFAVAGAAAASLAMNPSPGLAATTIGVPTAQLTATGLTNLVACGGCTYAQFRGLSPGATVNPLFVAPNGGVIVRWRLGSVTSGNPVTLRALAPAGEAVAGVGTGTPRTTASGITVYENERLRIRAGDTVGLNEASTQSFFRNTGDPNDQVARYTPAVADNGPSRTGVFVSPRLMQLNADVEADADNDGFGDETQDACPISAAIQEPCADLQVSEYVGGSFTPGQSLSYTLVVRNNGSQAAQSASVVDSLPAGGVGHLLCRGVQRDEHDHLSAGRPGSGPEHDCPGGAPGISMFRARGVVRPGGSARDRHGGDPPTRRGVDLQHRLGERPAARPQPRQQRHLAHAA